MNSATVRRLVVSYQNYGRVWVSTGGVRKGGRVVEAAVLVVGVLRPGYSVHKHTVVRYCLYSI
jgi:hypothetical protein